MLDPNRKSGNGTAQLTARHRRHCRRIDPARKVAHDRDIGPEPQADRLLEPFSEFPQKRIGISPRFFTFVGEIEFPVTMLRDPGRATSGRQRDVEVSAGKQGRNAGEHGPFGAEGKKTEDMVERQRIHFSPNLSRGEQGFDLRSKIELFVAPGPVERTDPELVPGQDEPALVEVDQRKSELPAEVLKHADTVLFPEMHEDLRVAAGAEAVPEPLEMSPPLGKVEQLAVVNHGNGAVFIKYRLTSVRQADDAEPSRDQPETGTHQHPALIRSPVQDRPGHALQFACGNLTLPGEVDDSRNSTHES